MGEFSTKQLKFNAFDRFEQDIRDILDGFAGLKNGFEDEEGGKKLIRILTEVHAYLSTKKRIRGELLLGINRYMDRAHSDMNEQIERIEGKIEELRI